MIGAVHQPVMVPEVLAAMAIEPAGRYVDATFGRGGHSAAILACLNDQGRLLGLDRDEEAIRHGQEQFAGDTRLTLMQRPFSELDAVIAGQGWQGQVNGILFDLGVSSPQLDDIERGFSFRDTGPLDMRMDARQPLTAAKWIKETPEKEMAQVFWEFGEERYSRRIARAIVRERAERDIETTSELAELVEKAVPRRERRIHPATRTFQAIRIVINSELEELKMALPAATAALRPGGRLVVISFHSLEDRIVKHFIRDHFRPEQDPLGWGITPGFVATLKPMGKPQRPGAEEIETNPRARSAIMRVAERLNPETGKSVDDTQ